jgi:hypothetical protein
MTGVHFLPFSVHPGRWKKEAGQRGEGGKAVALERELETYRNNLPALLAHEGKFVLIHGDRIDSFWDTLDQAAEAGYQRFLLEPFLIKKIVAFERPVYSSRNVP